MRDPPSVVVDYLDVLLVSPPPLVGHQRIAGRLRELLDQAAPPGCEALEAVGVQVGSSVLIPDVVVARVQPPHTAVPAPADVLLVVEVVSPSSVTTDRASKPVLYAGGGIPAFWRVESTGGTVAVFAHRLEGSGYVEDIVVHSGQSHRLRRPFPVEVTPADLT